MPNSPIKVLGTILLTVISLCVLTILYYFIYYTWQFKYGSEEIIQSEGAFTRTNSNRDTPQYRADWETFVRKDNPSVGNKAAAVTIVMFTNFECPQCQTSFSMINQVVETFGSAVRVIMKNYPMESTHPNARRAAEAGMCANAQGKFWEFYNRAFMNKNLDESKLYEYAVESGVEKTRFDQCYTAKLYTEIIEQDLEDGLVLGIRGVPTYMVNGRFFEGTQSFEQWKTIIINALNQPQSLP